jgi:8-oxo-dGTP diphosphatase
MPPAPTSHIVVAALIRRGDEVLLVRQQGPNDPAASWALPGGVVEHGESLDEALKREVREETGLEVLAIGPLLYVVQMVNGTKQSVSVGDVPQAGAQSIAFIFAVQRWSGEIASADPDGFIQECGFTSTAAAMQELARLPSRVMRDPLLAYLRGEAKPGTVWLYRRGEDGDDVLTLKVDVTAV